MELILSWWSLEGPVSQIHSPHLHVGAPGIFSDLRSVQMLKRERERDAESNGKLPHLFIHSNTVTLVPEFAVKDLPLDLIATLVPAFAVKDLALGQNTLMRMMMVIKSKCLLQVNLVKWGLSYFIRAIHTYFLIQ